jgi:hypothetical protein
MFRKFKLGTTSLEGSISSVFVTDAFNDSDIKTRPKAVVFPVSILFDEAMQEQRAQDYCDYLNLLGEASKQAYENNKLINILKA